LGLVGTSAFFLDLCKIFVVTGFGAAWTEEEKNGVAETFKEGKEFEIREDGGSKAVATLTVGTGGILDGEECVGTGGLLGGEECVGREVGSLLKSRGR
jgi:hypothetical protein